MHVTILKLIYTPAKTQSESEVILDSVPREADEHIGHADAVAVLCVSTFTSTSNSNSNSLLPRAYLYLSNPDHSTVLVLRLYSAINTTFIHHIATTLIEICPTCIYGTHLTNQKN